MIQETYEQAAERTGRKWPFRTADWPCPACHDGACDRDIELAWKGRFSGVMTFVYRHADLPEEDLPYLRQGV